MKAPLLRALSRDPRSVASTYEGGMVVDERGCGPGGGPGTHAASHPPTNGGRWQMREGAGQGEGHRVQST